MENEDSRSSEEGNDGGNEDGRLYMRESGMAVKIMLKTGGTW